MTARPTPKPQVERVAAAPAPIEHEPKVWREAKPYDGAFIGSTPNLNSYAASAAFGLTSMALEMMEKAGVILTKSGIKATAETLASITANAQEKLTGRTDMDLGSHTRLRGALRTIIDMTPAPFLEDEETWNTWVQKVTARVLVIAEVSVDLMRSEYAIDDSEPISDQPWLRLVV